MFRNIFKYFLSFLILTQLIACGSASTASASTPSPTSTPTPTPYADEDFITDVSRALEARWDVTNDPNRPNYQQDTQEYRDWLTNDVVDAECKILDKYKTALFKDSKLQQYAISYINVLDDSKEALKYNTVDYDKSLDLWNIALQEREKLIALFVNNYGLTVDEKYQSTLDDLLTGAKEINEQEENEAKIENLVKSIEFTEDTEESDPYSGYKTYVAIVENNTGLDFSSFDLQINLKDSDDVIVDSEYSSVQNFKNGDKARFSFMTSADFSTYEITPTYYVGN